MTGGLMNLVAQGNENIHFNGNPKKTFFKASYNKYTNFGLQKFRIDYEGAKVLNVSTPTKYEFKIPRYADLLHDTYIVLNLPDIWSPFYYSANDKNQLIPYEFKWIREIGVNIINEIEIVSGGYTLCKYNGEYLSCLKERDFTQSKKNLWDKMTGNIPELYEPENCNGNINTYPNAMFTESGVPIEPSIRGRKLYIPMCGFFGNNTKTALPLVALQYSEITIKIEFKPIIDLFTINNIEEIRGTNSASNYSYRVKSNHNIEDQQIWRFTQPPRDIYSNITHYIKVYDWNVDIHLISTYIFLDADERRYYAKNPHTYLIKQVYTYDFFDVGGNNIIDMDSKDMVCNYMWRFRRSDAKLRNEWSNYTNWAYQDIKPQNLMILPNTNIPNTLNFAYTGNIGLPNNLHSQYPINIKNIMTDMGIIMNGVYREKVYDSGIYEYIEKFNRSPGSGIKDGLYCYNFCIDSNYKKYQPSGAINVNKFGKVSFEISTIDTPYDASGVNVEFVCDDNNNPIGFRKSSVSISQYNFNLRVFEERYNIINIQSGQLGLLHAR